MTSSLFGAMTVFDSMITVKPLDEYVMVEFGKGAAGGFSKAAVETVGGIIALPNTISALGHQIKENGIRDTAGIVMQNTYETLKETVVDNVINGDARTRGEVYGRMAFEIAGAVFTVICAMLY